MQSLAKHVSYMWKGKVTLIEPPSYVRNNLSSSLPPHCTVPHLCQMPVPDESQKWTNPPQWTQCGTSLKANFFPDKHKSQ